MIIRAFEEQVEKTPDKVAVKGERESITYRELNRYANRIACGIKNTWPGGGNSEIEPVGLLLDHGPRMIAAILGTLKAGKVYVPLTPDYPDKRIFYILTHSRAGLIITNTRHEKRIKNMVLENNIDIRILNLDTMKEDVSAKNPNREIKGDKIAYIMYTSGSTGKPKGVLQTHEGVVYFTRKWTGTFSITSADRLTLVSSFCHDMSLQDMFAALHNGAVLYPYDMRSREENTELSEFLIKERITIWHSVPSLYSYFAGTLTGAEQFADLRFILLGGEPVRQHEVAACKRFFSCSMLAVVYGQTESSFNSVRIVSPQDSFEKSIIGTPLEETRIFVIDEEGDEVNPLETGEIIVASRYVSPGYWRDEETTRSVIREDPEFGRLYRTGDLGCLLLDGSIEFKGRRDWQVKIRGYRVELGEIENVLLQHDEIDEAAAVVINSESGMGNPGKSLEDKYIAAYTVSRRTFEQSELREYVSRYLPDYMIPTYFVHLDALPLTISGKIDRKALPVPEAVSEVQYIAPRNDIEKKLVEIWSEVLNKSKASIGIDDNFFNRGGHSLKAALLVSRIHQELEARLPLVQIFRTPSVRELARYIKETQVERFFAIPRLEEREYYDVSNAQQRVWIQSQEKQASLSFNMIGAYVIEVDMDRQTLDKVFKTLIQRHESLRTVFITAAGKPKQKILPPDKTGFEVEYIDLRNLRDETLQTRTRELAMSESDTPFDLSKGPLLRVKLIRVKERTFLFLFTMHHIISDALSLGVFFREVFLLYRSYWEGKVNLLSRLRIHYKDYAAWQNRELRGEKLKKARTYWLEQLGGNLPRLQLPSNKERPKIMTYKGGAVYLNLDGSLTEQLKSVARQQGTTLFMVLLAAFKALLARYTGQTDVIIGTVAACREYAELENQVGYYLNTLALRTAVKPGDSFSTLLKKVKETTLAAYEHQLYPFDRLVSDLGIPRDISRHPIFDIVIDMVNYQVEQAQTQEDAAGSGVKVSPYVSGYNKSKFDLTVYIFEARERMGLKFEYMTDIFEHEIIQRMSDRFLKLLKRIVIARKSDNCLADLLEEEDEEITFPVLKSFSGPKSQMPASYHQERLWFIDQFESGNIYESAPMYHNIPLVLEIHGALDIALMEQSIREIIRRHQALRTAVITVDNRPIQLIRPAVDFRLTVTEIAPQEQHSFLLDREPLIRGMVLQMETNRRFLLVITVHHIIADRYSLQILAREILLGYDALLKGGSSRLPDLPLQYADFSQWQQSFTLETLDSLMYYWRWKLRGKIQALELPTDRPRAPIHVYRSGSQSFTFPEALTDKINAFTKQEGISSFVFLLGVFKILLHRYSQQEEIVVGTGMRNRNQPGTENIIGPIANLVVLRSFLKGGTTFNDLVSQLKETVAEAGKYQAMPFDRLVLELKPDVDMSRTALFDVLFQYEEDPFQLPQVNGLKINIIETNLGWGKYDLNMLIQRKDSRYSGVLVYNREYHNESTILRFIGHFMVLLEEIQAQPLRQISQFNLLTKEEQWQLLREWNQPRIDYPEDKTLHELFEEQVERNPDRIAVIGLERRAESVEQMQITYRLLNEKSHQLAWALREKGVLADDIVGIKMERTIEMIIGILGILKAGGAYLPIDPEYPEERIDFILKDSGAKILLTNMSEGHLIHHSSNQFIIHHSSNLAYIIYTSGTTGQPKGCMITHKNVISLLKNKIQPFDFDENDIWTMFHQYNFDFSVWEMYGALLYGGKLIVIPKMVTRDPGYYLEILKQEKVTVLNQTPSAFYHLSDAEVSQSDRWLRLRYIIFGGEALNPVRLQQWRAKYPDTMLINMFGITETTIHVTYKEIGDKEIEVGTSNIGRPISTLTAYVVDRNLNLMPIGVPGELCVGGEGLARGYLNRPQLTAEKFIEVPFGQINAFAETTNDSLYRSGDLVKLLENGDMEYLGRIDHQVKIRGFRIELGEIETQLIKHESIKEAVVISRRHKTGDGNPYLCAYIVPSRISEDGTPVEKTANITELRKHLSQVLPDYMIPTYFIQLTRIPLTSNGKVDRKALPEPEEFRPNLQQTYVAPENDLEAKIAKIWQEVLQLDRVGTRDNFFEIGGDSLKTVQLKSRLEQVLDRSIPVVTLFERMTIHSFMEYLTGLEKGETEPEIEKKIDRSEAITRARDSRTKQRLKRKVKSR